MAEIIIVMAVTALFAAGMIVIRKYDDADWNEINTDACYMEYYR